MGSFMTLMDYYRAIKRAKSERKGKKWQLAAAAAANRLPLTGSPKVFTNPSHCRQWVVTRFHLYKPGAEELVITRAMANIATAGKICRALRAKEARKKFPKYGFRVRPAK